MLVANASQLEKLNHARDEIGKNDRPPTEQFYQDKLSKVWQRALSTERYQDIGIYSSESFGRLELTTKEQLKGHPLSFAAVQPDAAIKYYETTGTSGRTTPTPRIEDDIIWNVVSVAESWHGVLREGDRVVSTLPSDVVPVADLIANVCEYLRFPHLRAYPFATGVCDFDRLIDVWGRFRPTCLFIAPGVALQFTQVLKERGQLDELSASLEKILLLGEVNTPAFRARLEEWWGASVYDASYGSTETGTLATCCPEGNQHLLMGTNYFELADEGGTAGLGERDRGRLVVTPLNLYARPLIRLDTGDEVETHQSCRCSRTTPVVEVQGRSADRQRVGGADLRARDVEEVVYQVSAAAGYLIELDETNDSARLVLERDRPWDRGNEPRLIEATQDESQRRLGMRWDSVRFVNRLPSTTKSGGSQKSWKRTNIRVTTGGH